MDMSAFTQQFVDEARERLQSLNHALLRLEEAPGSADVLADVFREAHSLKGSAQMLGFVDISQIAHQLEELFVAARRDARIIDARAFDLVFRAIDVITGRVEALARGIVAPVDTTELGDSLAAMAATTTAAVTEESARPSQDVVRDSSPPVVAPASGRRVPRPGQSFRVPLEKLEGLTNLAPEMVLQSLKASDRHDELRQVEGSLNRLKDRLREVRLVPTHKARGAELGEYADALEVINRRLRSVLADVSDDRVRLSLITEELRQHVIELTMLPLATVFDAFPRAVRDLARSFDKDVELTITGRDTELDKRIIEQVADPLIHLIRNAIDHGIETPAERISQGKTASGTVLISAEQNGNRILVTVRDDGRGINAADLRVAAVRKGIGSAAELKLWTDEQLLDLIFAPGFSTKTLATNISGRGVGMDVVRVVVDGLGGAVRVESQPGRGTSVVLDLPLSLALLRVVLVEVNDQLFGIPTAPVRRIQRLSLADTPQLLQGRLLAVDGETIPVAALTTLLDLPSAVAAEQTALVVEARGGRFGVIVQAVRAELELVFKELRGPVVKQQTFAGAALLGNGEIVPILDVQALFAIAMRTAAVYSARPPAPAPAARRSARVLVVDDSLVASELERGILLAAGYDTQIAHDGLEALEVLRQTDWDLVISDVDMPRMDGFELTACVRADARLCEIPVIIVSSRDSAEHRRRGFEVGANAYVSKREFDQTQILETVRRLIAREALAPSPYSSGAEGRHDRA